MKKLKKILLLATGGTIASKYTEDGLKPQLSAEDLLDYVPEVREFCQVDYIQLFSITFSALKRAASIFGQKFSLPILL